MPRLDRKPPPPPALTPPLLLAVQARSYGLVPLAYFNSMLDEKFLPEYSECAAQDMFLKLPDGSLYTFIYKGAG